MGAKAVDLATLIYEHKRFIHRWQAHSNMTVQIQQAILAQLCVRESRILQPKTPNGICHNLGPRRQSQGWEAPAANTVDAVIEVSLPKLAGKDDLSVEDVT